MICPAESVANPEYRAAGHRTDAGTRRVEVSGRQATQPNPVTATEMPTQRPPDNARLDRVVAEARRAREAREQGYREQALKIYPWICGRCGREFDRTTVRELTVHHRDHNHDNNPPDGSNWELLCVYCHDNEHQRELEHAARGNSASDAAPPAPATHRPFADLKAMLKDKSR